VKSRRCSHSSTTTGRKQLFIFMTGKQGVGGRRMSEH